jgi:transcriptional regulator with XRE-family HTH domain
MARKLKMSAPYYSQIENGSRRLSADHLVRIAKILDVTLGELSGEFAGFPDLGGKKFKYVLPVNNAKVYKSLARLFDEDSPKSSGDWQSFLGRAQRAVKKAG